ncbi:MAG: YicC family protein [Synergistaceae bacterium]|nr:YicC family protein [Synergistaceae bacterium]
MFISMTGFGSSRHEFSWGNVLVEITSVNHKYQDFSARLPRELSSLENKAINIMRSSIARGKVKLSAEITWNPGAHIPALDEEGLLNLINQVRKIAKRNQLEAPSDITNFLLIPGVYDDHSNIAEQEASENPEIWDEIIAEAIKSLNDMKRAEGLKLKGKVEADLNMLVRLTASLKERWEAARNDALESLRTRIETVMEHYDLEIDEARVAQEVSLMSDKWDVSEELVRIEAHTEKFRQIMESQEPSGKRLDFLIQEMNREINTMGSKVADAQFRWGVVEAKSCVERMREQIQNIE